MKAEVKTLDAVKARGQLVCGVNVGLAGFSAADDKGVWSGLDVDYCKAIAAAVLGDASKARAKLGWRHKATFATLVAYMVEADLKKIREERERHNRHA